MSRRRHLPQRSTIHAHGRRSAAAQSHRPRRPSRAQTSACIAACVRACVRACVPACVSVRACARAHVSLSIGRCVSLGAGVERQVRSLLCRQRQLRQNRESDVPSPKLRMCETHRYDREACRDRSCADPYWPGRWSVPLDTLHFVAIWRHAAQLRRTWNAHEPRAALTPQAAWRARPELPLSAPSLPSGMGPRDGCMPADAARPPRLGELRRLRCAGATQRATKPRPAASPAPRTVGFVRRRSPARGGPPAWPLMSQLALRRL